MTSSLSTTLSSLKLHFYTIKLVEVKSLSVTVTQAQLRNMRAKLSCVTLSFVTLIEDIMHLCTLIGIFRDRQLFGLVIVCLHVVFHLVTQKKSARAEEYIRMIKERLPEAVQQCIHAAAGVHEPAIQRSLLRVS